MVTTKQAKKTRTGSALSTKEIISGQAKQATKERGRGVLVDQSTYNYLDHPGELNLEDSLTIPDQSYNIADIVQRFTMGQPLNISQRTPFYLGSEDFNDIDPTAAPDFDLVDADNLSREMAENQQLRYKQQVAEEEQQRQEEQELMEAEKRSAEATKATNPTNTQ